MNRLRYIQIITLLTVISICIGVVYMHYNANNKNRDTESVPTHQAEQKAVEAVVHESPDTFPQPQETEFYSLSDEWIAFQQSTNTTQDFSAAVEQSTTGLDAAHSSAESALEAYRNSVVFHTGKYSRLMQEDIAVYGNNIINLLKSALNGDSQCAETLTGKYWDSNCAATFVADKAFEAAYKKDIQQLEKNYAMLTNHPASLIFTSRSVEAIPSIENRLATYYLYNKKARDLKKVKYLSEKLTRGRSGKLFLIHPKHPHAVQCYDHVRRWYKSHLESLQEEK